MVAAALTIVSCGGGSSSKSARLASVTLDELDDYFTVKSYTLETNAEEKGPEKLDYVKGTLTLVVKRGENQMKYKPSQVDDAGVRGSISSSNTYVFGGDCKAVIKKMLKMEPGTEETFSIGIKGYDPFNSFWSDEQNAENRQNAYDALTKPGCLDEILFDIDFQDETLEALRQLKELADEFDEDEED